MFLERNRFLGFQNLILGFVLFQVYGGDEGWPFIEETSYSTLVDRILENFGEEAEEKVKLLFEFSFIIFYIPYIIC